MKRLIIASCLLMSSLQVFAASSDIVSIYESIKTYNVDLATTIALKDKTSTALDSLYERLKAMDLIGLAEVPLLHVEVITDAGSANDFLPFALLEENTVKIVYNLARKDKKYSENDADVMEFSFLHEIAHLQHNTNLFQLPYTTAAFNESVANAIAKDNTDVSAAHMEAYADAMATVWFLKLNSEAPIDKIIKIRRDNAKKSNKKFFAYDTATLIEYFVAHRKEMGELTGPQLRNWVLYRSSLYLKERLSNTKSFKDSPIYQELRQSAKFSLSSP